MPLSEQELAAHIKSFEKDLAETEWQQTRIQKKQEFAELLSKDRIQNLEEGDIRELVRGLWSFRSWTDKDYIVDGILENGIEPVAQQLETALHETEDRNDAFDALLHIPRFGPATASEILMFVHPQNCGIINRRAREALEVLSYDDEIPDRVTGGSDYEIYMATLSSVLTRVKENQSESTAVTINDYVDLDYFLYYLSELDEDGGGDNGSVEEPTHDEAQTMIEHIGQGLGFDTKGEYQLAAGARIDVRWKSRVANLGTISYFFEVHKSGSRDSAVMNLKKAETNADGVQRLVIVSDPDQLEKFKADIGAFSADFAESVSYMSFEEVVELDELVDELQTQLEEVGLLS